jgi:hypothetical protein
MQVMENYKSTHHKNADELCSMIAWFIIQGIF